MTALSALARRNPAGRGLGVPVEMVPANTQEPDDVSALLKILIVDDAENDAAMIKRALEKGGFRIMTERVNKPAAMSAALAAQDWDVVLCDHATPRFNASAALKLLKDTGLDVPFILVSGKIDERAAVAVMKAGARDYIKKSELGRLAAVIERELKEGAKRRVLNKRYHAFARLGQSLSSATSPQDAARLITSVADELIGWDSCFLDLYAPTLDKFYHVFDVDIVDGKRRELHPEDWGTEMTPLLQKVIDQGPQLIIRGEPEFNCDRLRPFGDKNRPSACIIIVPVRNGEQLLGFLSIQTYKPKAYTEEDVETLQTLADYCGGALERIRLEKEILEISSREQRRIGQNLHDGLCQHLAGIAFRAQILSDKLGEKSSPEKEDAERISTLIEDAIAQTRGIARGLFPVQLEENGLISALEELATNTEKVFKVKCVFRCADPVLIHDSAMAENLYYIAHEGLMNALKHSKATKIEITLGNRRKENFLTVRDNGIGIKASKKQGTGMGLHIMRYRARLIGATVEIKRAKEAGTVMECVFSLLRK